jgi:hypothetical protein
VVLDERSPHDPNTFVGAVGMGKLTSFVCTQWYEYRESNLDKKDSITFNLEGLEIDWHPLHNYLGDISEGYFRQVGKRRDYDSLVLNLEWLSEQEGITIE